MPVSLFAPSSALTYTANGSREAPLIFRKAPTAREVRSEGRLAQLVRAPALQAGGRRFESCTAHQIGDSGRKTGDVVQLVRTLPCHGRGRGFESRRPRQFQALARNWRFASWSNLAGAF